MTLAKWKTLFSHFLMKQMDELNINQKELAKLCKVSDATISRYISGQRVPTAPVIISIARALHCSTDDLIDFGEIVNLERR